MPTPFTILKERTLIPHPSSNGFRTGIYFEVVQHQEFITSFWNVGENGHSNSTALGIQQTTTPSHRMGDMECSFLYSPSWNGALSESGHSQLEILNNSASNIEH